MSSSAASIFAAAVAASVSRPTRLPNRCRDVRQSSVLVDEHRDLGPIELCPQVRLTAVDDGEIRLEGQDALEIGIQQGSHALNLLNVGRIVIEAADTDHLLAGADGEQHLGHRRNQ